MLNAGLQVSSAGKIYYAIDRAVQVGCTTMQIFSRNPRKFRKYSLNKEDIAVFREKLSRSGISPLVIHSPYTLNLAASKKFLHWITTKEFILDMIEIDKLGADYFVTHTGCYKGLSEAEGLKRVVKALRRVLNKTKGVKTRILLENTAGSGTWLGGRFSDYRYILEKLDFNPRVGICLDTAHAWCAGYPINNREGINDLLFLIDKEVGLDRLHLIHLNDTNDELGSKKDRHVNLGEGKLGEEGIGLLINHPRLKDIPFILETPRSSIEDDPKNMNTVRRLYHNGIYQRH